MTIRDPLDVLATPDPPVTNQETPPETPAPAGVSALGEDQIDEILVAGLGSRLVRPIMRAWNISGASRQINIPDSLKIDTKRSPKEYFSETQPAVEIDAKARRFEAENLDTPEKIEAKVDELDSTLLNSEHLDFDLDRSYQINPDQFTSPADFQKAQMAIAERHKMDIDRQRRGVVTDNEVMKLARTLSDDPEFIAKFIQNPPGTAANAEMMQAARILVLKSAENLKGSAVKYRRKAVGDEVGQTELEFLRNWNIHKELLARFMGVRAEAGRALRAISGQSIGDIKDLPRARIEELLSSYGSGLDPARMADAIIANPDGLAVNKTVNAQSSGISKWGAAIAENMVGSILSGISTFAVNPVGNALMVGRHAANLAVASRLGNWRILGGKPGQGEIEIGEASAFLYGAFAAQRRAAQAALVSIRTTEPYGGSAKFESVRDKAFAATALGFEPNSVAGASINVWGTIARAPMERILGPTDALFKVTNEGGMWAQLAFRQAQKEQRLNGWTDAQTNTRLREIMATPDKETLARMKDHGEYQTFTNPLGPFGAAIQKVINQRAIGKLLIPVFRTPLQITKVGFLQDTPLGLFSGDVKKALYPKPEPGTNALSARQIEDMQMAQSRMVMGTMMMTTLAALAFEGHISGSGPREPGSRDATRESIPPRSFVTGRDENGNPTDWRSFDRMEPVSLMIGLVADFADVVRVSQYVDLDESQMENIENLGAALTLALYANTVNKTYMRGLNEAIDAMSNPDRYYERWAASMTNAQIPLSAARRDLRKAMDPMMRQAETILERLQNSLPYFSKGLPAMVGIHGDYMPYEHILNLPFKHFEVSGERTYQEYARLFQSTRIAPVTKPSKTIAGIKLDADLLHDVTKISRDGFKILWGADWQPADFTVPSYDADAKYQDRVKPVDREGYLNFPETIERLILSEEYNGPDVTDYRRTQLIRLVQGAFDKSARQFLKANNEKLGKAILLKAQNQKRRELGRKKADQLMQEQGITPLTPVNEQPINF